MNMVARSGAELVAPLLNDTRMALLLPEETTFEQWEACGYALAEMVADRDRLTWYICDWIIFGEDSHRYGEMYAQAIEATGLSRGTLTGYVSHARKYPPERRRPNLSFRHHAIVSSLDPYKQEVWLDEAERHGLATDVFYEATKAERDGQVPITALRKKLATQIEKLRNKVASVVEDDLEVEEIRAHLAFAIAALLDDRTEGDGLA